MSAQLITSIGLVLVALVTGFFGWRNSGRATMSADQRNWLETAMKEARTARTDANAAEESAGRATKAANSATDRADAAERKLSRVSSQADDLVSWIVRVLDAAQRVDVSAKADPAVANLLLVINGGPPGLSSDRLTGGPVQH